MSGRKTLVIAAFSLAGGMLGLLAGRVFAAALEAHIFWVGPVVLAGSVSLLVTGLLLLPAAVRAINAGRRGPEA
jgi:hypothetical protein